MGEALLVFLSSLMIAQNDFQIVIILQLRLAGNAEKVLHEVYNQEMPILLGQETET